MQAWIGLALVTVIDHGFGNILQCNGWHGCPLCLWLVL
jgi:hypothetical protein